MFEVTLTEEQATGAQGCRRALAGAGGGLTENGQLDTVAALEGYVATLETLGAAQGSVSVSAEQCTRVEKTEHILEGVRDGLSNADFESSSQGGRTYDPKPGRDRHECEYAGVAAVAVTRRRLAPFREIAASRPHRENADRFALKGERDPGLSPQGAIHEACHLRGPVPF